MVEDWVVYSSGTPKLLPSSYLPAPGFPFYALDSLHEINLRPAAGPDTGTPPAKQKFLPVHVVSTIAFHCRLLMAVTCGIPHVHGSLRLQMPRPVA